MTPQERQLVSELFDRLETLENAPRDREAERAVAEGLARAPHSPYPLVQTVLVQDEALKRADARIRELEAQAGIQPDTASGGFLDTMRDSLFGRREQGRGSVPSVRSGDAPMGAPPGFRSETPQAGNASPPEARSGFTGGSFLGTAAAGAAGVIGGAMLLNGIRSMFGQGQSAVGAIDQAHAKDAPASPWGESAAGGDLARQAGLNDIGGRGDSDAGSRGFGLFDNQSGEHGDTSQEVDASTDDVDADGGFDAGGDE